MSTTHVPVGDRRASRLKLAEVTSSLGATG